MINIMNLSTVSNNNPFAPSKVQTAVPTVSMIDKLSKVMPSKTFNSIIAQIAAMAELDEQSKVGKKLDIAA